MFDVKNLREFVVFSLPKISTDTIGWFAILFFHCSTIPSLLGLLFGTSDRLPSIDVVLFVWTGLVLLFVRALIVKDMLNVITIGFGFMIQAALMGLLVFR